MVKWYGHLSSVSKVVVIVMVCAFVLGVFVVAYSLMGPTPIKEMTN